MSILVPKYPERIPTYTKLPERRNEITVFLNQHLDDTKNFFKEKKII